jgi:lipoprotein-anchoring transpeptidase ErfK/SrfK
MKTSKRNPSGGRLTRREFLQAAALGMGAMALAPRGLGGAAFAPQRYMPAFQRPEFPQAERLGRAARGSLEIKSQPDIASETVGLLYEDEVAVWLREVIGRQIDYNFNNQRWVETPDGYVFGGFFQPVRNLPNEAVTSLPPSGHGPGMWAEVSVPYVDVQPVNAPSEGSWVKVLVEANRPVRLYYSQIFWIDDVRTADGGQVYYRVNPNYYGGIDLLWAPAYAFRPLTDEDLAPIHPDASDKRIVVDINHQVLSCYEGNSEVYFCQCSTGAKYNLSGASVDAWLTPIGTHRVTRKYISLQMSSSTTGASYDSPGIGWSSIFATGGVAVHSTYWHNSFGTPISHGCVNVAPQDANWIFRWTAPNVLSDPGMLDVTQTGEASTAVEVVEG